MTELVPKDRAEAVALFRSEIIGALARRELEHGELTEVLTELSGQRFRAPGNKRTTQYSVSTLQRWLYAYKQGGLEALRPRSRSDKGRARKLTTAQRELLLEIRREYPKTSVVVILRTLVAEGRLDAGAISETTVRQLYRQHGLDSRPPDIPLA